tara:strand:- start:4086 stop:5207 length:1122 start_codon:yes stop_codon:yes gene_type:complete
VFDKEIKEPKNLETLKILEKDFNINFNIKGLQKFKKFKTVTIIGMGGSILGSQAVYNLLRKKIKKKFYFFDNLDTERILDFKKKQNLNQILFIIISKSGNTIETLSNFLSLNILKKNSKNIIVISERKDNHLISIVKKFNLFYIEHKRYIGGRYSVLSEVGLLPAYLMGLNISSLRSNLKRYFKGNDKIYLKESVLKLSNLLYQRKISNLIFINYIPEMEQFLYWCQQLIAESLGKNKKGFLPVVSNAPKDHHSLLQLYLDGPKDKLFHIFSLEYKLFKKINSTKVSKKLHFLNNKTLSNIKTAQKNALIKAFNKKQIPFREFKFNKLNEQVLGELFSYFILETIIIGKVLGLNPFDQPAVEQVKIFTKDFLK